MQGAQDPALVGELRSWILQGTALKKKSNKLLSEQALGVGDGQGSLACYSPRGCKESNMTEWLNWTELLLNAVKRKDKKEKGGNPAETAPL